jgi:hypothetical protein
MLPRVDGLKYAFGGPDGFLVRPLPPFAPGPRELLARLSERLVADPATRSLPDVMAFAFWCRKGNVERQARYDDEVRLGRGLAFHVAPANMPVNFAFSWAFSLLAGNANVVRIPNREFPQIPAILRPLEALLSEARFAELAAMNRFVTYGHEEEITRALSAVADVRIIWGGDATIQAIRRAPIPPRAIDVSFADRYSFSVLGARSVAELADSDLGRLAAGFFNDAYLMDQNACSSPRLVVWLGTRDDAARAAARFWAAVSAEAARRYELSPVHAVDKLTQVCRDAIELDGVQGLGRGDNRVVRVQLADLPGGIERRRCGAGYFYEHRTEALDDVARIVTDRYQTVTYHGVPAADLAAFVVRNRLPGIDRIVPVGAALDIGLRWDGYDLIRTLSRVCDVR